MTIFKTILICVVLGVIFGCLGAKASPVPKRSLENPDAEMDYDLCTPGCINGSEYETLCILGCIDGTEDEASCKLLCQYNVMCCQQENPSKTLCPCGCQDLIQDVTICIPGCLEDDADNTTPVDHTTPGSTQDVMEPPVKRHSIVTDLEDATVSIYLN